MGKADFPLVKIPHLKSKNQGENNGKLLRRPQRRAPIPPVTHYISPPDSPILEDEFGIQPQDIDVDMYSSYNDTARGQSSPVEYPPPPSEAASSPTKPITRKLAETSALLDSIEDFPAMKVQINAMNKASSRRTDTRETGKVLLKTQVHAGPDGLKPPAPRMLRNIVPFEMLQEKGPSEREHLKNMNLGQKVDNDPAVRVNQFMKDAANNLSISQNSLETVMYSRANVRRLTEMIYQRLTTESNDKQGQITVNTLNRQIAQQDLPYRASTHAVTGSRVPQTQILIQMASMLTEQIQSQMDGKNIKAIIRPFPKWSPSKPIDEMPRAEIVLYEQAEIEENKDKENRLMIYGEGQVSGEPLLLKHSDDRHFMDTRRNQSPYDLGGENGLDNTDIALLDALITGGAVLSLKAHFITALPDISPMYATLRYINLSFNSFEHVPPEVLILHNLEVLKLRNNPIREIPDEIRHLEHLRTFEMPFCLIEEIPEGFYTLKNLQYLDLSYNKLTKLPDAFRQLKSLQVLFVEGNQLVALPCACLALSNLRYIRVRNNFMHPVFWPEHTQCLDSPQRLQDMAGLVVKQHRIDKRYGDQLPETAKLLLTRQRCDCCHGHLSGEGLTLIRPGSLFGVKNVPFMFKSCSHYCAKLFMANEEHLIDLVYADSDWSA